MLYLTERPRHVRAVFVHYYETSIEGAREDNMLEFCFAAVVKGFHVYSRVWLPQVGQRLSSEREHGNVDDRFAIAFREQGVTRAVKLVSGDVFTVKSLIDRYSP